MDLKPSLNKADSRKLGYIGAVPGSNEDLGRDSDSWFTPRKYIDLVKQTLGDIDLDPFSSKQANELIQAKRFFDEKSDAFKQVWFEDSGRVFMNPPYSRQLINASIDIFVEHWKNGKISEAIVLVNNATETKWFQQLLLESTAICLVNKRIAFENRDGKHVSGNTRGQVFLYFGKKTQKFNKTFGRIGAVLKRT
ncbi:DNA N-6-adenine-methyltransferase [Glaciecola siphonariae]|uniref:DNA N-6-adenine-methyltransferase n=1 Tax=Glaciecola siphonariae TaxID=521012 RepID=A0ABV9LXD4_9ALTE